MPKPNPQPPQPPKTTTNTAPTSVSLFGSSVLENATASPIGILTATDPDKKDVISFSVVGAGADFFEAVKVNGVWVLKLKANTSLDYEVNGTISVDVKATDKGGLSKTQTFTITVGNVNEAPTEIGPTALSINENNEVGATVATLSATDSDAGDTFTYALVAGDGDTDNAAFTIDGDQLTINVTTDYESTKTSYDIRIRVTDAGGLSYETTKTITVDDVTEGPVLPQVIHVTRAVTPTSGTAVEGYSYLHGWSPDGSTAIIWSNSTLTEDDTDSGATDLFAFDAATGENTLLTKSVTPTSGTAVEGESHLPWNGISPDSSTAIIQSTSTLTEDDNDAGSGWDLFALDMSTGQTRLLTNAVIPTSGTAFEGESSFQGWSADSSTAIIQSTSTLTEDDNDSGSGGDVFALDMSTGQTKLLTNTVIPTSGTAFEGQSYFWDWIQDGSTALLWSTSTLTEDDTDSGSGWDLFAVDMATGQKTLLTKTVAPTSDYDRSWSSLSPDGSKAIILSIGNWGADVFPVDTATGHTTLLSETVASTYSHSYPGGWSPDGSTALIISHSTLSEDDTDAYASGLDVFAVDMATGGKTLLTKTVTPTSGSAVDESSWVTAQGWSPDSSTAIIQSTSTLTVDDTDSGAGGYDLFAVDMATGGKTLLTKTVTPTSGTAVEGYSHIQGWSPDSSTAIILSESTLTEDDTDSGAGGYDLFAVDMATGGKTLLTGSVSGEFDGISDAVWVWPDGTLKWSADGKSLIIVTTSTMSADDLDDGGMDLYSVDVSSGAKTLLDLGIDQAEGYSGWGVATPTNGTDFLVAGYSPTSSSDYYWVSAIL